MQKLTPLNKKGVGGIVLTILIAIIIIVLIVIAYGIYQSVTKEPGEPLTITGDCEDTPTVDSTFINAVNRGTSITGVTTRARTYDAETDTWTYIGEISSSTEFEFGQKVQLMFNISNYIDEVNSVLTMKCGTNRRTEDLYATSTNTFKIKNTDGTAVLTDADTGGTNNQSSSASTLNFPIQIDSSVDESTGDLIVVIETNDTEVSQIILNGLGCTGGCGSADVPEFRTDEFSGDSISKAFEVPAVFDGNTVYGTLAFEPESGETIGAGDTIVYVTAYSKQALVDTDGTFKAGIEDSDGTAKYEDVWDFDFMIT